MEHLVGKYKNESAQTNMMVLGIESWHPLNKKNRSDREVGCYSLRSKIDDSSILEQREYSGGTGGVLAPIELKYATLVEQRLEAFHTTRLWWRCVRFLLTRAPLRTR